MKNKPGTVGQRIGVLGQVSGPGFWIRENNRDKGVANALIGRRQLVDGRNASAVGSRRLAEALNTYDDRHLFLRPVMQIRALRNALRPGLTPGTGPTTEATES